MANGAEPKVFSLFPHLLLKIALLPENTSLEIWPLHSASVPGRALNNVCAWAGPAASSAIGPQVWPLWPGARSQVASIVSIVMEMAGTQTPRLGARESQMSPT